MLMGVCLQSTLQTKPSSQQHYDGEDEIDLDNFIVTGDALNVMGRPSVPPP